MMMVRSHDNVNKHIHCCHTTGHMLAMWCTTGLGYALSSLFLVIQQHMSSGKDVGAWPAGVLICCTCCCLPAGETQGGMNIRAESQGVCLAHPAKRVLQRSGHQSISRRMPCTTCCCSSKLTGCIPNEASHHVVYLTQTHCKLVLWVCQHFKSPQRFPCVCWLHCQCRTAARNSMVCCPQHVQRL